MSLMVIAGHFCQGTDEESTKAPVSLVSWKDEFLVSSSGTLAKGFEACAAPVRLRLKVAWQMEAVVSGQVSGRPKKSSL